MQGLNTVQQANVHFVCFAHGSGMLYFGFGEHFFKLYLFTFQDIVPIFKLFYIVSYLNPFKTDSLKAKFWPAQKD